MFQESAKGSFHGKEKTTGKERKGKHFPMAWFEMEICPIFIYSLFRRRKNGRPKIFSAAGSQKDDKKILFPSHIHIFQK